VINSLEKRWMITQSPLMEPRCAPHPGGEAILSPAALDFIARLHGLFEGRRRELLGARRWRRACIAAGDLPDFAARRAESWQVPAAPKDLVDRRVELTGPVGRKMMVNALNSGASVFMADFEDATSPTWANMVEGQRNLRDAYRRTLSVDEGGRRYRLEDDLATLVVRPRGWHLEERHVEIEGRPVSASLFDVGLALFHNARQALDNGSGPYFYLPKLEGGSEARLWHDVFVAAEDALALDRGSIRATVLIESIHAAFEMDEILGELGEHATGLNAGRWDYMFSIIKAFASNPMFVLPDRADVTMTTPFMRAYTELLVATCHRRGAHAIGGMSAFIPSRRNPAATASALAMVEQDKRREATDGFDGTWVAHPDLIPKARAEFDTVLGGRLNQLDRRDDGVRITAADLLTIDRSAGGITEHGLRLNIDVSLRYLSAWLSGTGAVAIHDLMEDTATAEISRSQVWQWIRHGHFSREHVVDVLDEVTAELTDLPRLADARAVFDRVAIQRDFVEFLTLPAYPLLHREENIR
jgi:malate synthase